MLSSLERLPPRTMLVVTPPRSSELSKVYSAWFV